MISREELVCLWFDYNDYSFSKLERILHQFDKIDSLFDKKMIKTAFFDKDLEELSNETIVAINYDLGMGYSIDYWHENDIVQECEYYGKR